MCGIFGYIGKKNNAAEIVLEGLKGLEYRGYDSWGIAVKTGDGIAVEKHTGKIGDGVTTLPGSSCGIGHTRWATHGGVTLENAHPHSDCTHGVAVLHNGIIENFQVLKEDLIAKGHTFLSETDTEVVPHLIEDFLKEMDFKDAVQKAFGLLQGLNAIVVLHSKSSQIIAAKNGSPLILGIGEGEFFAASDASEIIKHTKKVIFLEDRQMAVLSDGISLFSLLDGREITPEVHTLDWKFELSEKGEYEHFMLKEIHEQPKVLESIALNTKDSITSMCTSINNARGTFMLGCGTASYAALSGIYLFSSIAKKHINFSIGSEFGYLEDYLNSNSLLIPISQSGETIDIVDPVTRAKEKGVRIAAITNVLGSTLYREAHEKVLLGAGPEKAVVGTKSFTAMIAVLIIAAYTLAQKQNEGITLIQKAAENVAELLQEKTVGEIRALARDLLGQDHLYVLGRGLSYAAALECALKIKETTYTHAEGFAGGELKHGVISLIDKGTPCIIIAPNDETYDEIVSNAQEVRARGGFIIGIGPKNNNVFDRFIQTADAGEATLIPQVVVAQLLAYELALAKGIPDPDKPRNLAKSVTVK